MNNLFQLATNLQIWAVLLAVAVLTLLLYWEFKRNRRIGFRVVCNLLVVGSLLMLALQPTKEEVQIRTKAILLTDNYPQIKLDSLLNKYSNAAIFSTTNWTTKSLTQHDTLHIIGDGFLSSDLPDSINIPVILSLNPIKEGITHFQFFKKITTLDVFKLQGIYNSLDTIPKRIILTSPIGEETITTITTIGHIPFDFQQVVRQEGRYLYTIEVETAGANIQQEVFPVIVNKREKLKVLFLNDSPNFETKYIKNWLAEGGHSVAVRTTISREKYNTEFINFPKIDLSNIDQKILENLDVLVTNAHTIHQLTTTELAALRKKVEQGLGLIILPDERLFAPQLSINYQSFFFGVNFKKNDRKELIISNIVENQNELITLNCLPYQATLSINILPVFKDDANLPFVISQIKNQGRITSSIIPITYTLLLQGKKEWYNTFWSGVFQATTNFNFVKNDWTAAEELMARPNEAVIFQLHTEEPEPIAHIEAPNQESITTYLQQLPLNTSIWQGTFWPLQAGWQELSTKSNKTDKEWIYVQAANTWAAKRQLIQQQANLNWWSQQQQQIANLTRPNLLERKPLPLWWFYVGFLIGIAGLWIEEKW